MEILSAFGGEPVPSEVAVCPVIGTGEQRRWDALAGEHHYLPFNSLFGKSLRHVAVWGEAWLALPGWAAGAFKVGARDAWIGWSPEQQFSRLHLIANNSRFVMLTERGQVPNLASRILALSLRRLSSDMRELHGFPVLLAETFVDPSRFGGICYRASNWRWLGLTKGFSRLPGDRPNVKAGNGARALRNAAGGGHWIRRHPGARRDGRAPPRRRQLHEARRVQIAQSRPAA